MDMSLKGSMRVVAWITLAIFFVGVAWIYFDFAASSLGAFIVIACIVAFFIALQIFLPRILLRGYEDNIGAEKTIRLIIFIIMLISISFAFRYF